MSCHVQFYQHHSCLSNRKCAYRYFHLQLYLLFDLPLYIYLSNFVWMRICHPDPSHTHTPLLLPPLALHLHHHTTAHHTKLHTHTHRLSSPLLLPCTFTIHHTSTQYYHTHSTRGALCKPFWDVCFFIRSGPGCSPLGIRGIVSVIVFLQLHHSALTSGSDGIGEVLLSLCDARSVVCSIIIFQHGARLSAVCVASSFGHPVAPFFGQPCPRNQRRSVLASHPSPPPGQGTSCKALR